MKILHEIPGAIQGLKLNVAGDYVSARGSKTVCNLAGKAWFYAADKPETKSLLVLWILDQRIFHVDDSSTMLVSYEIM